MFDAIKGATGCVGCLAFIIAVMFIVAFALVIAYLAKVAL